VNLALPAFLEPHRRRILQWIRYAAVSVVANLTTVTVLGVLVGVVDFAAGWSNVVATAVATIPSFELNRRWVWSERGRSSLTGEVIPFWIWAFAELGLSSLAVHLMGQYATAAGWDRPLRTFVLEVTTIATTGLLWIVQFFLFDRVLFARRRPAPEAVDTDDDRRLAA
jgi:putative flippase GtrA